MRAIIVILLGCQICSSTDSSDVCSKLGCFQSTSTYSALEVSRFVRYINPQRTYDVLIWHDFKLLIVCIPVCHIAVQNKHLLFAGGSQLNNILMTKECSSLCSFLRRCLSTVSLSSYVQLDFSFWFVSMVNVSSLLLWHWCLWCETTMTTCYYYKSISLTNRQ